ncbi:MAG: hypothetical protein ACYCO5_06980 [Acidobacteriaceae bacterium]
MIARIWHGIVPVSKGQEYLHLMRTIALPEYLGTCGNRGAQKGHEREDMASCSYSSSTSSG